MVQVFKIPISFKLDESSKRFAKNLENQTVSGTPTKGGKGGGALSELFGSIGTFLSAAGPIGIAIAILSSFKPVITIVKQIFKVLIEFLRPIADMVILVLLPLLQIIKPILQVVRQIMAPFRKLAFSLSKQATEAGQAGDFGAAAGLFGLSLGAMTTGIQAVFGFFTKSIIDQLVDLSVLLTGKVAEIIITLIGPLLSIFGINVDSVINNVKEFITNGGSLIKDALAFGFASSLTIATAGITNLAKKLGADVVTEYTGVNEMLKEMFISGDNSFANTFNSLTGSLESTLRDDLTPALDGIVQKFQDAANRINSINISGGGGSRRSSSSGDFNKLLRVFDTSDSIDRAQIKV